MGSLHIHKRPCGVSYEPHQTLFDSLPSTSECRWVHECRWALVEWRVSKLWWWWWWWVTLENQLLQHLLRANHYRRGNTCLSCRMVEHALITLLSNYTPFNWCYTTEINGAINQRAKKIITETIDVYFVWYQLASNSIEVNVLTITRSRSNVLG